MRGKLYELIKRIEKAVIEKGSDGYESSFLVLVSYNKVHDVEIEYNNETIERVTVFTERKTGCEEYLNLEEAIKNAIDINKINDEIQDNRRIDEEKAIEAEREFSEMWDDYLYGLSRTWSAW